MKTAIVILNWNGKHFLEKFLPGLTDSISGGTEQTEIIVADNGSTDGSLEFLSGTFPSIHTITFDRNYGFTGGYNRALRQIDAQYYILLNSDIEVTDGWLEPLVEWMDTHPFCGACAPKLLSYADREMFEYAGAAGGMIDRYGSPFCKGRILKMTEKDYGQYDEPEDVLWASGACLMVRADIYRKTGGLDERFFAHQEEIDLCWRIQLEGYNVTIIPESKVFHVGGGTLQNGSPWKLMLNYRNNLLMLSNNLAKTYSLEYFNDKYMEPEGALLDGDETEAEAVARKAAAIGLKRAGRTIFIRKTLDGLSAAVYLVTFRWKYFKAVLDAHREYKALAKAPDKNEIIGFLLDKGKISGVTGIYRKWIIPRALLHGKDIFKRIRQEI